MFNVVVVKKAEILSRIFCTCSGSDVGGDSDDDDDSDATNNSFFSVPFTQINKSVVLGSRAKPVQASILSHFIHNTKF